ncbi:MAG: hypothetical protein NTZ30_13745 [Planctomycetota bacterium]|nr:hypothetical protein [Planctomycetota bacterium]
MIKKLVFSSLLLVLSFQTLAAETVSLSGSGVRFSTMTDYLANAKSNKMALTGVAMLSMFMQSQVMCKKASNQNHPLNSSMLIFINNSIS